MSRDIEISRGTNGAVGKPAQQRNTANADPGRASDINALSFGARAYTYEDDIPTAFRVGAARGAELAIRQKPRAGGALVRARDVVSPISPRDLKKIEKQVIASGARQLDKPRKSLGRIVQRRIGWQATPTQVVVTTAERELTRSQQDAKKMVPKGDWLIEHRKTYPNTAGAATKRTGVVDGDYGAPAPASAATPSTPAGASAAADAPSFPEGEFALSLLPSQVRSSVIGRVPTPTVFDGTVLQVSDGNTRVVSHQEINLIRMNERTAVVVQAKRKPGTERWEVSQATYALGEPRIEQA